MTRRKTLHRRTLIKLAAANALLTAAGRAVADGGSPAHVVIAGGGFAGATCARYLRRVDPGLRVTLVEPESRITACPMSNWLLIGRRRLDDLAIDHAGLRAAGVEVVRDRVNIVDGGRRKVGLAGGGTLAFDRLVLAPGIRFKWGAPEGYDEAAAQVMPHAWRAGAQTELLLRQLQGMADGGVVGISVPAAPFRCPPGPYERASLVAWFLREHKPRSKVLILDANDKFSKQALFKEAWDALYPGMIEWLPVTEDGAVRRVDPATMTLHTEFAAHRVAVANVIPVQAAGEIAGLAGLADASGWCPVDPLTFESVRMPGVHVIGDAAIAQPMPKSASAANSQAKNCALAIARMLRDEDPGEPSLHNTCYSLVAPDHAISINGIYRVADGAIVPVEGAGGVSPTGAPAEFRAREARYNQDWYESIVTDSFGRG